MAEKVTQLTQRDIEQAIAKWVDEGCESWASNAGSRISFHVDKGDPGHYADSGQKISATVKA